MANKKIRAEVHINDPARNGDGVTLVLTDAQATDVLNHVVSGEVLSVNLVTNANPVAKDFDYSQQ